MLSIDLCFGIAVAEDTSPTVYKSPETLSCAEPTAKTILFNSLVEVPRFVILKTPAPAFINIIPSLVVLVVRDPIVMSVALLWVRL